MPTFIPTPSSDEIKDALNQASPDVTTWHTTPLVGISKTEHKLSFPDVLIKMTNRIFIEKDEIIKPIHLAVGMNVANVVRSLPGFYEQLEEGPLPGRMGVLNGNWQTVLCGPKTLEENSFVVFQKGISLRGMIKT